MSATTNEARLAAFEAKNNQITKEIENRICEYSFISGKNNFFKKSEDSSVGQIDDFTLLNYVSRFYYSPKGDTFIDKNGKEKQNVYVTNIIFNEKSDESMSFYKNGEKIEFFGKLDFTFEELKELGFKTEGLNKKIVIYGLVEGRIIKVESSYTSEKGLKNHIFSNGYNTVDMKGIPKAGASFTYNVIGFKNSTEQIDLSKEKRNEYLFKVFNLIDEENRKIEISKVKKIEKEVEPDFDFSKTGNKELKEEVSFDFSKTREEVGNFGYNPLNPNQD